MTATCVRRALAVNGGVVGLALLAVCFAPAAVARTRCSYSGPPGNVLTVRADKGALTEILRSGSRIVARELLERPARCAGGVPTVLNTDTIRVEVATDDDFVDLYLGPGAFVPGATPETEGESEIEIEILFPLSGGLASVHGTRGDDEFLWGPGPELVPGLNLNPRSPGDVDIDVTARGGADTFLDVDGGAGDDTIGPAPGPPFPNSGVFVDGEEGNDRLTALANSHASLQGGPGDDIVTGGGLSDFLRSTEGNDRISGGGGADTIYGGAGRDLLDGGLGRDLMDGERGPDRYLGGPGRDRIFSRDSRRETVSCGAGRDRVAPDRRDRLLGCEVVFR